MTGKLIGIAKVAELRAPLQEMNTASVSVEAGIDGDARGRKIDRQVTVLFRESWDDACRDLGVRLPWTTRRANLLVEGIAPPQQTGGNLKIGDVILKVMLETDPCMMMERAHEGLKAALTPDWRGGVCCKVVSGGDIKLGDTVQLS
jgi:MOSC domain-containing protein YiiM